MLLNLSSSDRYYTQQQGIAASTVASAKKLWRRMDDDFDTSWRSVGPAMLEAVQLGRTTAAQSSLGVTAAMLAETDQTAPPAGALNPSAFVAYAPDGRPMGSLLSETVVQTKLAVKSGQTVAGALSMGEQWLTAMLLTVMADTGRGVIGADMLSRPKVGGYVRMLNAPSCPRCVILAGKWFRYNQGFLRHPRCDCRHIPVADQAWAKSEGFISDPYEYFHAQSKPEQDRIWGRIEARAIRDGADIRRIENVRLRGLATAKGNLRFGTPSRLTIDDIYRSAGTRKNAIALMEREGYITGPQTVAGNIIGRREGFGALGKGGRARAASDAVVAARASGARDPLNRYTMTAAERRLYDAQYRLEQARRTGMWPRSIGRNSADLYSRSHTVTAEELAMLEQTLKTELAKLPTAAPSVRLLAGMLGL